MSLEEEVCSDDLLETLRRVRELAEDGDLEVVSEDVFRVLQGLGIALRGPVNALEAGLVVVGLGTKDKRLDGYQHLQTNGESITNTFAKLQ